MLGAAETDPISTGNEKRLLKKKKKKEKEVPTWTYVSIQNAK